MRVAVPRIECVWNHVNYWVNMQTGMQLGAPGKQIRGINIDLDNRKHWERASRWRRLRFRSWRKRKKRRNERPLLSSRKKSRRLPALVDGEGEVAATSADGDPNTPVEGEEGEPELRAPSPSPSPRWTSTSITTRMR